MNRSTGWRDPKRNAAQDTPMLVFEIVGLAFVTLFLAALVTGREGTSGR